MRQNSAFLHSAVLGLLSLTAACGEDSGPIERAPELTQSANDHWFYSGPIPELEDPAITVSLTGHTARVTGFVQPEVDLSALPHARTKPAGSRTQVDLVYPIATADSSHSNSKAGVYEFWRAIPFRPDGTTTTETQGPHFVTWGGFPFVAYNKGIAFHGPITPVDSGVDDETSVWYLKRGRVSGGCNRMMGEHVIELAHIIGVNMHKVYRANQSIVPETTATVTVTKDYDMYEGKYVDVDYPTSTGVTRPKTVYGEENVEMFGSWVATEATNGSDLPPDQKWEGGVSGKYYVFAEHARAGLVCRVNKSKLSGLSAWAETLGGELPGDFCDHKDCILDAISSNQSPEVACGL